MLDQALARFVVFGIITIVVIAVLGVALFIIAAYAALTAADRDSKAKSKKSDEDK
jgi:uncharacterized membrane-anchored protein